MYNGQLAHHDTGYTTRAAPKLNSTNLNKNLMKYMKKCLVSAPAHHPLS